MAEERRHDEVAWPRRATWAFLVFASIGAFFLLVEHRAHVLPWLPWLILAACPLMHVFMHGGHGGHHNHRNGGSRRGGGDAGSDEDGPAEVGETIADPKGRNHSQHGGRQ